MHTHKHTCTRACEGTVLGSKLCCGSSDPAAPCRDHNHMFPSTLYCVPLAEAPSLNDPPISLSPSSSSCFSSKNSSSLGLVLLNSFQLPAMHLLTHLSITSYLNTKAPKYAGSNHAQFVFLIFSFLKCGEALGLASRQSSGQSYKFYSLKYQFYGQRD